MTVSPGVSDWIAAATPGARSSATAAPLEAPTAGVPR